jgi:hypothetical protein
LKIYPSAKFWYEERIRSCIGAHVADLAKNGWPLGKWDDALGAS